jgi:hypothetical protein
MPEVVRLMTPDPKITRKRVGDHEVIVRFNPQADAKRTRWVWEAVVVRKEFHSGTAISHDAAMRAAEAEIRRLELE